MFHGEGSSHDKYPKVGAQPHNMYFNYDLLSTMCINLASNNYFILHLHFAQVVTMKLIKRFSQKISFSPAKR